MARFARAALLGLGLAWSASVPAQPAAGDAAYAALEAASARESRALEARERAFADAREKEDAARAAAQAETARRQSQVDALARIDREIVALLDRIEGSKPRPDQLLLEQAVLQDWYEALQPAAANLTERSFLGAEAELDALAASGAIGAGPRRFKTYLELRNRLADLGRAIAGQREQAQARATALRTQLEPLARRRAQALAQLARADNGSDQALKAWLDATRELERVGQTLVLARQEVEQATSQVLEDAGKERPPILLEVDAGIDGQSIYTARWQRADGSSDAERDRKRKRDQLAETRTELTHAIEEATVFAQERSDARTIAATQMHSVSGMLQRSAARYAEKRMDQVYIQTGADVGLTVAEIFLTGGAATLARKAAVEAEALASARAAVAARKAAAEARETVSGELAERVAMRGEAAIEHLQRAARSGRAALQGQEAALVQFLIREGATKQVAEQQARAAVRLAIARLELAERSARLANQAQAAALKANLATDPVRELLEVTGEAAADKGRVANTQLLFEKIRGGSEAPVPTVGTQASIAVGEGVKTGLTVLSMAYQALPDKAAGDLASRMRGMGANLKTGMPANGIRVGVGVVSSTLQVLLAGELDEMVNREAAHFANLMAELNYYYAMYQGQLAADREFEAHIAHLRSIRAGVDGAIKLLDGGMQMSSSSSPVKASKDGQLGLTLGFSTPLAAAPSVTVGGVAMQMRSGDGRYWQGGIPVSSLRPGSLPVVVSVSGDATPYGALDSDPTTPAIRLTPRATWSGYEAGADEHHRLQLAIKPDEPSPSSPPSPASDPFEEGRRMVEAGAAMVDPDAPPQPADLAGVWNGTGYYCEADQPVEQVQIRVTGDQLVATKLSGDACVRTGEVTWRGRMQGRTIQVEFHVRDPNAGGEGSWMAGTLEVISRDEIRGFGLTYTR